MTPKWARSGSREYVTYFLNFRSPPYLLKGWSYRQFFFYLRGHTGARNHFSTWGQGQKSSVWHKRDINFLTPISNFRGSVDPLTRTSRATAATASTVQRMLDASERGRVQGHVTYFLILNIFCCTFTRHEFLVVTVKELLKSVYFYQSYRQNKSGVPLFGPPCILE